MYVVYIFHGLKNWVTLISGSVLNFQIVQKQNSLINLEYIPSQSQNIIFFNHELKIKSKKFDNQICERISD